MLTIQQRCQARHTRAFVAADTVDHLAGKLVELIADRRLTLMTQYLERDSAPRLTAGLRPSHRGFGGPVTVRAGQSVSVALVNQSSSHRSVFFGVHHNDESERQVRERYNHPGGRRENVTRVELNGNPGSPAADDHIRIVHWNEHGLDEETVVVFDNLDLVEEIGWQVKGDLLRQVQLWDEFCLTHRLHFEHPDHTNAGCAERRQATLSENLAVLAHLAHLNEQR